MVDEHNNRAWVAWHVAALQRAKSMPRLQSLLAKKPKTQSQTMEEQIEGLTNWVRATGGKVIYKQ